ncbi:MAG: hypothetical protein ACD_45C00426G0004 [uncultured bacterium]|nr:MAG: hypothetical protein ACD_45C00426G0004 [uncultured bacterium]
MSKYTVQDQIEEQSIIIIRKCLDSNLFDTTNLAEKDKNPDTDGHIRLRDTKGNYLNKYVHVQIKGSANLSTKYHCTKKIVDFACTTNVPFILLIVDVTKGRLFWHVPKAKNKNKGYTVELIDEVNDHGKRLHKILNDLIRQEQNQFNAVSCSSYQALRGATSEDKSKGEINKLAQFLDKNLTLLSKQDVFDKLAEFKAIATNYALFCYWVYLGNFYSYDGQTSKAKYAYKKAIRTYKKSSVAVTNLALMYCLESEPHKAITLLKKYEQKYKKSMHYWTALGQAYMSIWGHETAKVQYIERAQSAYKNALCIKPSDSNVAFNLLASLRNIEDKEEYEKWKKICKKKFISDPLIRNEFAIDEYDQFCRTLDNKHLDKMGELLITEFNKYIEFDEKNNPELKIPPSPYNRQVYQPILDNTANYLYHKDEKEKALRIWLYLTQDDDTYKSAHQNLTIAYIAAGNFEEALKHIKKAKGHPRFSLQVYGGLLINTFFYNQNKNHYWNLTLLTEAKEVFHDAFKVTGNLDMAINEAACMLLLGKREAALMLVSKIKEQNPLHYFANLKSIQIRSWRKNDITPYINEIEQLSEKFSDEYEHIFQLAVLYDRESEIDQASTAYEVAIDKLLKHAKRMEDMRAQDLILQATDFFIKNNNSLKAVKILKKCISELKFVDRLKQEMQKLLEN